MKIYTESNLQYFRFWAGARDTANALTYKDFEALESLLCIEYPDGIGDTELNDLFWFAPDYIAQMLGYSSFEDLERDHSEDD